jgi:hypothetical protein
MPGISRPRPAVAQPLADDHNEPDEQARNGGGNHDEADKADRAQHDVAHRDLTGDGGLPDGLDDDRAGLAPG